MDTERRMTTQEMLTQHKKLMDEAQRLEPSVMVTERNWNAMLKMQHNLFQQQMQLDTDLKMLLTKAEAQEALNAMQASATEFAGQAGSLSAEYSSACKELTESKDIYDDGRLFLDFSEQMASLNGKPLTLSPMEYKMLNLFRKNPRQVLTRGQLLEKLWDIDEKYVDEHTLTTSISRIRSKIESDGGAPYIKTVYGMGYQWTGGEAK